MAKASDLPETMTAVTVTAPGPADMLQPVRRPLPTPGPGEVLIRVAAAGLNFGDTMQREGSYPAPPGTAYDILGLEVSGTVAALGPSVDPSVEGWAPGDAVCALLKEGGYAEYCLAAAPLLLPVPAGIGLVEAAALPEAMFTVWTNLFDRGRLRAGERVLVHGGSSGIGTTAIQLAAAFGARVFATAGSAGKCAACVELGAEQAINYRETDFVAAVAALTDGQGVDLILDMVAGDYTRRNIEALALEGRLVMIGLLRGGAAEIDAVPILVKRLTVTGSTLWARTVEQKAAIAQSLRRQVWPLLDAGQVKPVVHATYPLADAERAHRALEAGTHIGKILLVP